jgi:hypothetical protein
MLLLSTGRDGAKLGHLDESMKEYYSLGKTQSLRNKIATFNLLNILWRLYRKHSSVSMSTLERFHITSSRRNISFKSSIKDLPWLQGQSSMHRREDPSSSLHRPKLSLYSIRSQTMTHGRHMDAYFRGECQRSLASGEGRYTRRQD